MSYAKATKPITIVESSDKPWKLIDERNGLAPEHWHKRMPYGHRPFIAWDGEGITFPGNDVQSYVLFGNSVGDREISNDLSTELCFELLLKAEEQCPEAIHIGFSLQYDINMMFRDIPIRALHVLYRTHKLRWNGYRIEYRPSKWLNISRVTKTSNGSRPKGPTVRLYDVFGFFQSSFVKALERFIGTDNEDYRMVVEGKKRRKEFALSELWDEIIPYWRAELRLMVTLMNALRMDLINADLAIKSWHGPGAIANEVFRTHKIERSKGESPAEVNRAAQFGYAGGRFELLQAGHYGGTVYEYDIRSAYPTAIASLPSLSPNEGHWERTMAFVPHSFGIWKVDYRTRVRGLKEWFSPNPLFYRDEHGNVSYPSMVQGWYWTPEAELVRDSIIDGWIWLPTRDTRPFSFVREMYDKRAEYKREGISAEKALKLALNSLYGKMAQRTGWQQEGDPIPHWHQLEWAGYVTSSTRSRIWNAIQQKPNAIIAIETDAVFSTEPLDLNVGDGLGQWEMTTFDNITYIQNGFYWASKDGVILERFRGVDKDSVLYIDALAYLDNLDRALPFPLKGITTRFIGMGLGLHTKAIWRSWETNCRDIHFGGGGKRKHTRKLCPVCRKGNSFSDNLHPLTIATGGGKSAPHSLPWLVGVESELRAMDELERW